VTTVQELKLAVAVLVVVDATDALEVAAALDEVVEEEDEEEPHAARRMAAGTETTIPKTSGRNLIRSLDPIGGRGVRRSVLHGGPFGARRYAVSRLAGFSALLRASMGHRESRFSCSWTPRRRSPV
jgi:hypothetical protein